MVRTSARAGYLVLAMIFLVAVTACSSQADVSAADGKDDTITTVRPSKDSAQPSEVANPNLPSDADVKSLIEALASSDIVELKAALPRTKRGSVARGYLRYLIHGSKALIDGGAPADQPSTVKETSDGYKMCSQGSAQTSCYTYTDFEGDQGKIVDFKVNDKPLGPRLLMGNGKPTSGTNGLQGTFVAAFEASNGRYLIVGFQLRTRDSAFVTDVTYRNRDGRQTASAGISGPSELGNDSLANFQAVFPGAKLGGVMTVKMYGETSASEYVVSFDTGTAD